MKQVVIFCMMLMVVGRSYGQDSLKKDILLPIVKEFATNNSKVKSYEKLPEFIRYYLEHQRFEFKISKRRLKGACSALGPKRKLFYILKCSDNFIISYAHAGHSRHFHSVIFMTNGKEI